jgi:hypothetical protein
MAHSVILKQMLESNGSLEKLDLGWNNMGNQGIAMIYEGLLSNHSIRELNVQ